MRATACQCDQCGRTIEVPGDHPHSSIECRDCLVPVFIPTRKPVWAGSPADAPVQEPGRVDQITAVGHYCHEHPRAPGTWRCERCERYSCEDCAHQLDLLGVEAAVCACKGRLLRQRVVNEQTHREEFRGGLREAVQFPFRGSGKYLLLVTVFVTFLATLLSHATKVGGLLAGIVYIVGTLWSFVMAFDVIRQTIEKPERDLEGPDVHNIADLVGPMGKALLVSTLYLGPFVAAVLSGASAVVSLGALALGAFLWPMGLLTSVVFDDLHGLHPVLVIRSIAKCARDYVVVSVLFLLVWGAAWGAQQVLGRVPILAPGLALSSFVYFMAVEGRLLGMLYRVNRERLAWV